MADDQAMQTGPLFLWIYRKHLKPRYKQLFDLAHDLNLPKEKITRMLEAYKKFRWW